MKEKEYIKKLTEVIERLSKEELEELRKGNFENKEVKEIILKRINYILKEGKNERLYTTRVYY